MKKNKKKTLYFILILIIIIAIGISIGTTGSIKTRETYINKPFPGYNIANGKLRDLNGNIIKEFEFAPYDIQGDLIAGNSKGLASIRYWNNSYFLKTNYKAHHDLAFTKRGTLLFLSYDRHIYKGRNITFDTIIELSFDGELINKWSSFDNKDKLAPLHEESPLEIALPEEEICNIWSALRPRRGCHEYYHFNSINELPKTELGKKDKRFQAGNWIISDRKYDLVFIIDKDTKEVVWSLNRKHDVRKQHDAKMLPTGNILIFDNGEFRERKSKSNSSISYKNESFKEKLIRGYSRVVEYDPEKDEIVWEYGNNDTQKLLSTAMGGAQRLPNGNTLITESREGRVFEVTKEKEIIWEWNNPENDHHRLNNSVIYRAFRLPTDFVEKQINN